MRVQLALTELHTAALAQLAFALIGELPGVIAGGFAAAPWIAEDVDLWMFGDPLLDRTMRHLTETGIHAPQVLSYSPGSASVRIETPLIPIHIIGTSLMSVEALLGSFDISTHRHARTRWSILVEGPQATRIYESGRVLIENETTAARRDKLQARYDIKILPLVKKEVA